MIIVEHGPHCHSGTASSPQTGAAGLILLFADSTCQLPLNKSTACLRCPEVGALSLCLHVLLPCGLVSSGVARSCGWSPGKLHASTSLVEILLCSRRWLSSDVGEGTSHSPSPPGVRGYLDPPFTTVSC